jgi:parallel beta-helix repeat protein
MDSIDDLPPPDAAEIESTHEFYLYTFPDEVVMAILSFMSAPDLNNLSQCSVFSQHLANSNELWHNLFTRDKLGVQLLTRRQKVLDEDLDEEFDMDESEEEEDEDYTEETALRKKRKLALFKRLKTLLWRTAAPSDASPPPEEPAQKKIKLDLTAGLQEVSDEDESEPMDIDQSPVIIDAAQDFYDWKAIYRRAKAYESIQEAIDMAIDGDTIILGPGLYKEGICIEKSISLVGNDFESVTDSKNIEKIKQLKKAKEIKDLEELEKKKSDGKEETPAKKERVLEEWELGRVIISSNTYNTIEVTVNVKVLVKNVSIQQAVRPPNKCFGVCVDVGNVTLDNCEVSSSSLSTVIARKKGSVHVTNCWLSRSAQIGVFGVGGSSLTVQSSTIENTSSYAVASLDGSSLVLEKNKIIEAGGVKIEQHGSRVLQVNDNEFYKQVWTALRVDKTSDIVLCNNTIHKGKTLGVTLKDLKSGLIEGNKIQDNVKSGILMQDSQNVVITNNVLSGNGDCGIDLKDATDITIANNAIENNMMSGVDLYNSAAIIDGNKINNNNTGVYAFHKCSLEVCNNTLNKNKINGLEIRIGVPVSAQKLLGNTAEYNGENGVMICRRNDDEASAIDSAFLTSNNKLMGNSHENLFVEVKKYAFDSDLKLSFEVKDKEKGEITADVEEAIKRGVCTFSYTGYHFHPQYWWTCETCSLMAGKGFCAVCKDRCHKGHSVTLEPRFGGFYCDCGAERRCVE